MLLVSDEGRAAGIESVKQHFSGLKALASLTLAVF